MNLKLMLKSLGTESGCFYIPKAFIDQGYLKIGKRYSIDIKEELE